MLMDRDEIGNLYRGPSIDAFYQVSINLAQWFQRRRFFFKYANQKQGFQRRRLKCEKLTDDGRKVMAKAHFAFGKVS